MSLLTWIFLFEDGDYTVDFSWLKVWKFSRTDSWIL